MHAAVFRVVDLGSPAIVPFTFEAADMSEEEAGGRSCPAGRCGRWLGRRGAG